ncbi:uridine monophosphate kinase [Patescibacteria group bacterium]
MKKEADMADKPVYKRIVFKLTGEALKSTRKILVYDKEAVKEIAREILTIHNIGTEIVLVIGGGNIIRGRQLDYIKRTVADKMGMLVTMPNGLYLQDILEQQDVEVRVQSAVHIDDFAEPYISRKAISHLEKGRIVILVAGIGTPFFSTDQTAVLRALDLHANAIIKGTKTDGLYRNYPPKENEKPVDNIPFEKIREIKFGTLFDSTALELLIENPMPLHIINIFTKGNLLKVLQGKKVGTKIS